jgi:hypothetical protein
MRELSLRLLLVLFLGAGSIVSFAQESRKISGTVKDEKGAALVAATILCKRYSTVNNY